VTKANLAAIENPLHLQWRPATRGQRCQTHFSRFGYFGCRNARRTWVFEATVSYRINWETHTLMRCDGRFAAWTNNR
jgi:hypothetical protein